MPTLAQIEAEIVGRTGPWLTLAGLSTATDGTNPDLVGPIGRAIRTVGGSTASLGVVTQPDIDSIPAHRLDAMLDYAEVYTLEAASSALTDASQHGHVRSLDLEVFDGSSTMLADRIKRLWDRLAAYGIVPEGAGGISAGTLDLGISQQWGCS